MHTRVAWIRSSSMVVCWVVILVTAVGSERGAAETGPAEIASGERLVHNMDCNVCHTPKVLTPRGPQPDPARLLSGHPADEALPPLPEGWLGSGWGGAFSRSLTAWAGPWGVSFASNLTPDPETGLGSWSEKLFVESMRTGTHQEQGRPFLPPMPTYDRLTDEELHAIFAYLRSIPPVVNAVPPPRPPASPTTPEGRRD